jgi:hypothetical protein
VNHCHCERSEAIPIKVRTAMGMAAYKPRVAYGVTFTVMAGLVPAISRGTRSLRMGGHDDGAGFIQGGSADGRGELAMTDTRLSWPLTPGQVPAAPSR